MRFAIRLATADDRDEVVRLRLAFIGDVRGVDPSTFGDDFTEVTRRYLCDVEERDRIRTWLAEPASGGPTAGIVSVLRNDAPPLPEHRLAHEGYVVNLWVAPDARRQGLARALLQQVLDEAPAWGLRRLYLHATEAGRPLYEQSGFVPDARWMGTRPT